jgi:hypothetical protein
LVERAIGSHYEQWNKINCRLVINDNLSTLSRSLARGIPPNSAWIHVRRGDMLHRTKDATICDNIHELLKTRFPQVANIYIATNEHDLSVFAPLSERYNLFLYTCFPELLELKHKDNYMLFLVEKDLGRYFPVRISTFAVPGNYYQASLSSTAGWQ